MNIEWYVFCIIFVINIGLDNYVSVNEVFFYLFKVYFLKKKSIYWYVL